MLETGILVNYSVLVKSWTLEKNLQQPLPKPCVVPIYILNICPHVPIDNFSLHCSSKNLIETNRVSQKTTAMKMDCNGIQSHAYIYKTTLAPNAQGTLLEKGSQRL